MKLPALGLSVSLLLALGCGGHGGTQFSGAAPTAEATFGICVDCHHELAVHMTATGGHHDLSVKCEFCHDDLTPGEVGPGHRSVPACAECHSEEVTHHDPAAGTAGACVVCHTPHGSPNLFLVNEQIVTPGGITRSVQLTNLLGLADGSFASVTHPGSGLCEICHTTTQFYRDDGSGNTHFSYACFTCHPHTAGFAPR
jgi:predicted CXXCH cytochrome family protein